MKRVLVITYYWPPSGGGGVQRWLKMSKYLPQQGWQPVIFTPENPHFDLRDETLLQDEHPDTEVLRYPIWEPYRIYDRIFGKKGNAGLIGGGKRKRNWKDKLLSLVRSWFLIPDPRVFWVKPAVKHLTAYLREHPVDAIVTTGPPHSMHLIGLGLKKKLGTYWIADLRDAWTQLDYLKDFHLTKAAIRKQEKMEQEVVKAADRVLIVTKNLADWHTELYGRPVEVLTNGFDAPDFEEVPAHNKDRFIISHFGLLNNFRNPGVLWKVLDAYCEANPAFAERLELRLGGVVDPSVRAEIDQLPLLRERVHYYDYVSHEDVIALNAESAILLLCINNTYLGRYFMTGKIFEYLALGRPILCMSDKGSDAAQVIRETGTGATFDYEAGEASAIRAWLEKQFEQFPALAYEANEEEIARYSRENLSAQVVQMIEDGLILKKQD